MYHQAISQFARSLRNLDAALAKAERYAQGRGFDVNNFCGARLAPDMLPFAAQIRIACDHAKNAAASLSGNQPPRHEDDEVTVADLRGRIAKCLAYLEGFKPEDFAKMQPGTSIAVPFPKGKALAAEEYLWGRQIPNFYFHCCMAYAILRHGGVDLGKTDFLGPLNLRDA
jgi:hypothetical protein